MINIKDRGGKKLDTNFLENNYITLVGKVTGEKRLSHEIYGERFYIFDLEIPRLSGNSDIIPVTVSERIITDEMLQIGKKTDRRFPFCLFHLLSVYINGSNNEYAIVSALGFIAKSRFNVVGFARFTFIFY